MVRANPPGRDHGSAFPGITAAETPRSDHHPISLRTPPSCLAGTGNPCGPSGAAARLGHVAEGTVDVYASTDGTAERRRSLAARPLTQCWPKEPGLRQCANGPPTSMPCGTGSWDQAHRRPNSVRIASPGSEGSPSLISASHRSSDPLIAPQVRPSRSKACSPVTLNGPATPRRPASSQDAYPAGPQGPPVESIQVGRVRLEGNSQRRARPRKLPKKRRSLPRGQSAPQPALTSYPALTSHEVTDVFRTLDGRLMTA